MLGSFSSSHEEEDEQDHHHHHHHHHHSTLPSDLHHHQHHHHHQYHHIIPHPPPLPPPPHAFAASSSSSSSTLSSPSSTIHTRQLLITCAELLSLSNFAAAHRLISILSANSSPNGDSTERLVHQFSRALSLRLHRCCSSATAASRAGLNAFASPSLNSPFFAPTSSIVCATVGSIGSGVVGPTLESGFGSTADSDSLQSCYLTLNQVTPFIRFSHLTANQAILEAIEGQRAVHIVDLDIMHGVQWPPLMQALAERSSNNTISSNTNEDNNDVDVDIMDTLLPPPTLRITGAGHDLDTLRRTGDRLSKFAHSLGLNFQFHPLLLPCDGDAAASAALRVPSEIAVLPDETLAVNCVLCLHKLLRDDARDISLFLRKIKALKPRVVTVAEREANHNHPLFRQRFVEALDHYIAVFDSLEATLPPSSRERLALEQVWFGREIADIVAEEGERRRERHERFESWEVLLRGSGFTNVPLSPFALSQAKLLLRLHYPSEGYQLQIMNHSVFLGWQNRALFSVSSWR